MKGRSSVGSTQSRSSNKVQNSLLTQRKQIIQNILNKQKTYLSNSFTAAPVVSRDHIFHVSLPTPMKLELHNNPHDPHPGLKTNKPKLTKQTAATPNKLSCDTSKKRKKGECILYLYPARLRSAMKQPPTFQQPHRGTPPA